MTEETKQFHQRARTGGEETIVITLPKNLCDAMGIQPQDLLEFTVKKIKE